MESLAPSKLFFPNFLPTSANPQLLKNATGSSPELYNCISNFLVGLFSFKLPDPVGRRPLSIETFAVYIGVPFILNYAMAYLVLVPGTRLLRLAILPVSLWTLFNGLTTLDMSMGEPRKAFLNQGFALFCLSFATRNITWALAARPYRRIVSPSRGVAAKLDSQYQIIGSKPFRDAFELIFNLRGLGWEWSRGLYVPPEWRCTSSRTKFTLQTLALYIFHFMAFDICYYVVQSYSPTTFGSHVGGSIYEPGFTFRQQFIRSNIIVVLSGFSTYFALHNFYDFTTLVGLILFGQDPTSWPPPYKAPWFSTSLAELWSKGWHQMFRDNFIQIGAKPFSKLFGRTGGVMGAFLVSAIFHELALWAVGNGDEFGTVGGFFLLMGASMIAEALWSKITGRKVGGVLGWLWVTVVFITWGHVFVDVYGRKGLLGIVLLPGAYRPAFFIFGPLPIL